MRLEEPEALLDAPDDLELTLDWTQSCGGQTGTLTAKYVLTRLASPPANAGSVLVEFDRSEGESSARSSAAVRKSADRPLAQGSRTESQYR